MNILNSRIFGQGEDFIILHGLFGMKDNWNKFAKDVENLYKVHLLDIRNHGESFHSDEFNYNVMMEDVKNYMDLYNIERAYFMGHSLGGKILMNFICKYPEKATKVVIVDISPKYYKPHHHGEIILALENLDLMTLENRKYAEDFLMERINDYPTVMFLLKNLKKDNENFYWCLNTKPIYNNLEKIGEALEDSNIFNGEIMFIKGEKSQYIIDSDTEIIKKHFPKYQLNIIKNAGHIVHLENYSDFYNSVMNFL